MPNQYALSGVDVGIEAQASRIMYDAARITFENRRGNIGEIIMPFDDFSGLRAIDVSGLPEGSMMGMCFDGVGTKVELAERMGKHDTIAFDLFAMVCDDAVVRGAEPVLLGSILDLKTLGTSERFLPIIRDIVKGYIATAQAANVAVINGEIAQMGSRISGYGEFPYNWGAGLVWFARKEQLFTGKEMNYPAASCPLTPLRFVSAGYRW